MEHLFFWSKCSIFHNIFKSFQNLTSNFPDFFSMLSKNGKRCHDLKIDFEPCSLSFAGAKSGCEERDAITV